MDDQKQKYFESNPSDACTSLEQRNAHWARTCYYKHLRDFVAKDSLDSGKLAHRFNGSIFIPLIPPQSLLNEQAKRQAECSVAAMKPSFLSLLDDKLWAAWREVSLSVDIRGIDVYTRFRSFLEQQYFDIMHESCIESVASSDPRGPRKSLYSSGIDLILQGVAAEHSSLTSNSLTHISALQVLQAAEVGGRYNYQGVLVRCDDYPRSVTYAHGPTRKRKPSHGEATTADVMFADRTGPIFACLWGQAAESICSIWRQARAKNAEGLPIPPIIDVSNVRIQGAAKNGWNGVLLTHISMLTSVESAASTGETVLKVLPKATAPNLTSMEYEPPQMQCCISEFFSLRDRLKHPFRLTVKGLVMDLRAPEMTAGGNRKRVFNIVDNSGLYFTCCALSDNAESIALKNNEEVVLYFGSGRGPMGGVKGMLYLLKDALIIPTGKTTRKTCIKTEELIIK